MEVCVGGVKTQNFCFIMPQDFKVLYIKKERKNEQKTNIK